MSQTETDNDGSLAHLKFAHPNVGYVIDGLEDATVRYELEREFEAGQWIQLRTEGNRVFGHAKIEDLAVGPLRHAFFEMKRDGRSHPAESAADLWERMQEHYPDGVGYDDMVTIVYFDLQQIGTRRA